MTKKRKYTTASIPVSLIDKVDEVVKNGKHGYKNRADFILDSIRQRLRELEYYK